MNTKVLTSILFGFFAILLVASAASALTISAPATMDAKSSSVMLDVSESGTAQDVTSFILPSVSGITFNVNPSSLTIINSTPQQINVSASLPSTTLKFGVYTSTLTAVGTSSNATATITYAKDFCKAGDAGGNLSISSVDISSSGSDNLDWNLLDEVTVKVNVENIGGTDDIKDVKVKLELYKNGVAHSADLNFENTGEQEISLGTIKQDKEVTATFKFKVPASMSDDDYMLAIKAYSSKTGETKECVDHSDDFDQKYYQTVTISRESDEGKYIAFQNPEFTPDSATCGDAVTFSTDVSNVGDEDLQTSVKVHLVAADLGINTVQEITQDLNQGNTANLQFAFNVPDSAANGRHQLTMWAEYGYNNGGYDYKSSSNTIVNYNIIGCNLVPVVTQPASISASLESSEVVAGKDVEVKATITNLKNVTADFAVGASGYDSWAVLKDVSDRLVTLAPGQSRDVTFTLTLKSDAEGAKTFSIDTVSAGATASRDVELTVQKQASWLDSFGNNSVIWIIGAVNLILIVFIVIVAIKLARN